MSRLLQSVEEMKGRYGQVLKTAEARKSEAADDLSKMLEQQRTYSMLVKDLRDEMRKNEVLTEKLSRATSSNDHQRLLPGIGIRQPLL